MKILLLLLLLLSSVVHAESVCDRAFVSGLSYHFNRDVDHNERNYGIGCVKEISEDWRVSVGTYDNSFYRQSVFVFGSYNYWNITQDLHAVISVGGVTGYRMAVMPAAFPELRYDVTKKFDISLGLLPPAGGASGLAAMFFTIGW